MGLLAALSANSYVLAVTLTAAIAYVSVNTAPLEKVPSLKYVANILSSILAEAPLLVIAFKTVQVISVWAFGGFRYTFANLFFLFDFLTFLYLLLIWFEAYNTKAVVEKATVQFTQEGDSLEFPGLKSHTFWNKYSNFFWKPQDIIQYSGITYGTVEETSEAVKSTGDYSQPRSMVLDIYKHADLPSDVKKPVMIYIHGGSWKNGSRSTVPPSLLHLVENSKWVLVCVDYRLVPKNKYPTPLVDCKRAIRWVKANINAFGGDPDFIYASGHSSGGHMAVMCALTPGVASLQPSFTDTDTSIRGAVSLNGLLKVHEPRSMMEWFWRDVCQMQAKDGNGNIDVNFVREHSPVARVEDYSIKKSERGDQRCCPVLVVVGTHDTVVSPSVGKEWVEAARKAYGGVSESPTTPFDYQLLSIPGFHHAAPEFSSVRTHYMGLGMERWLNYIYSKQRGL